MNLCWKKSQVSLEGVETLRSTHHLGAKDVAFEKMYGSKEGAYIF